MDLGLKNAVSVVAGASAGLGRATAFCLASEGSNLAICSRSQEDINKTAEEIKSNFNELVTRSLEDTVCGPMDRIDHEILTVSEEREIYTTENQYVYIVLKISEDETEYYNKRVRCIGTLKTPQEFAEFLRDDFFGDDIEKRETVSVDKAVEIDKHEYETLKKFI